MKHQLIVMSVLVLLISGCSESTSEADANNGTDGETCGAKCDVVTDDGRLLTGLALQELEATDTSQKIRLVGNVSEDALFGIEEGHTLDVEIYASDGASNTDFRIPATLEFDADHVGGYTTDTVDIGELLPWQRLTVEVSGSYDGEEIAEKWHFFPGDDIGKPANGAGELPDEFITGLFMNNYTFADGTEESFRLVADLAPELQDLVEDGEELSVEIAAVGGASNPDFTVDATITYDADHVGGFITDQIDTSELLPWQQIEVRLFGTIGRTEVDETFAFMPGDLEGIHRTNDALQPTERIEHLEIINRETTDGETETLRLTATLTSDVRTEVDDGDVVLVKIRAVDGASNPEFFVPATMTYDIDNVGGYVSDTIDTSELLPYQALEIDLRGRVGSHPISESFGFMAAETTGTRVSD